MSRWMTNIRSYEFFGVLLFPSSGMSSLWLKAWASIEINLILIYLLTAIWLTPDDSSIVHIYTQTIHRTTQLTTLIGRLSEIRTQSGQNKINDELTA
jgi:uncharacterized integral membrane protein